MIALFSLSRSLANEAFLGALSAETKVESGAFQSKRELGLLGVTVGVCSLPGRRISALDAMKQPYFQKFSPLPPSLHPLSFTLDPTLSPVHPSPDWLALSRLSCLPPTIRLSYLAPPALSLPSLHSTVVPRPVRRVLSPDPDHCISSRPLPSTLHPSVSLCPTAVALQ